MFAANASRSRAWSPIAIATRGDDEDAVEIMPNGMLASEKCEPRGMLNHDRSEVMVIERYSAMLTVRLLSDDL